MKLSDEPEVDRLVFLESEPAGQRERRVQRGEAAVIAPGELPRRRELAERGLLAGSVDDAGVELECGVEPGDGRPRVADVEIDHGFVRKAVGLESHVTHRPARGAKPARGFASPLEIAEVCSRQSLVSRGFHHAGRIAGLERRLEGLLEVSDHLPIAARAHPDEAECVV